MAGFAVLVAFLLQTLLFHTGNCHVSLTFPPARRYALDFLDNLRTPGPCGMPKGLGPLTTFKAGSKINVTWHLAYPHQGGFHLAILDHNDDVVYNFFNNFIGQQDPTTIQHEVTIPDIACNNCSLQLTRVAGEWRLQTCDYIFWSCADINIIPSSSVETFEKCNGQPVINNAGGGYTCQCISRYHGDHCQFMNDCEYNSDCNNHGLCAYVEATSYPKRQCYCDPGWFGQYCQHESVVRTTSVDKSMFVHTNFSSQFQMYHRVLETEQELEVLLEVRTTTWVGLGLRPDGYRSGCQNFPFRYSSSGSGTSEPEPEGTSEPHPEGTSEPHPEGTSEPHPEGTAEPQPEGTSEPHPEGTSEPQPEGTSEPQPEGTSEPQPEGTSEPQPEGTSEPQNEWTPAPHICSGSVASGNHTLNWEVMAGTDYVKFTHTASVPNDQWMAVGFASNTSMLDADIYTTYIDNGEVYLIDSNTMGAVYPMMPSVDAVSNVMNKTAEQNGGNKVATFYRKRDTSDNKDFLLSETATFHVLFANGPNFRNISGLILYEYHSFRVVTSETFVIGRCVSPTTPEPAPEVTSEPGATSEPGVTPEPGATSEPGVTPEPGATSEPEVTPEPGATSEPGVTPEPGATSEPEVTPEPGATSEPEVTPEPGATSEPGVTPEPGATSEPEVTPEPGATSEPEVTPEPGATSEPGVTSEPGATSEPEVTPEPPAPEPHICTGQWNCDACRQNISWRFNVDTDEIIFTMSADIQTGYYFAAGISADQMMAASDIFLVEPSTMTVSDRWASGRAQPLADMVQDDVRTLDSSRTGTRTSVTFARSRTTNDLKTDWQFTDTTQFYILFARGMFTVPHTASYHTERYISPSAFKIDTCAKPEPEGEPTGEPEGEPTGEPEGEPEGSCDGSPGPSGTSDTTGSTVHPMDCTDMVIGSARGFRSRIGDYYSRDRSTPHRDVFYGGSESLTAAVGNEEGGVTKILYRRKIKVTERTDYEITNDFMHVIWAHGQENSGYNHSPNSGLEAVTTVSDKLFYKEDELKYHGNIKRGTSRVNFLKKPVTNASQSDTCMWANGDHMVTWVYMPDESAIRFSMTARVADNQYIALGLSSNNQMANTDVLAGWVFDGVAVMTDRWAAGRFMPAEDTNSLIDVSGSRANGITVLNFTRPLTTSDSTLDMQLTPDSCLYFFFGLGGTFDPVTRTIAYHDSTPIAEQYCVQCGGSAPTTSPSPPTVPIGPTRKVTMQFRLQDIVWQEELADTSSNAFRSLKSRVEASLIPILSRMSGYVIYSVTKFTRGSVIVASEVEVVGSAQEVNSAVNTTMQQALSSGTLGEYTVDRTSLMISESEAVVATTMKPAEVETLDDIPLPLIIILAFVGASVLLVLLLGMCNCVRNHNKKHQTKEDLKYLPKHLNGDGGSIGTNGEQRYHKWVKSTGKPNVNPAYDSRTYDNMQLQPAYAPQQTYYQQSVTPNTAVVPQRVPASNPTQPPQYKQQHHQRTNVGPRKEPEFRIETYVTD
ncbi:uncharacterized protein LOC132549958 [Ylistrum balloti]|uniref:uncharacterized protein LOC132549958 n=1 Tax=Ylistrum balloti TaxID=509963 RepID=UPI002905B202|nr:uncharacterized protein LOC132549958 [Ylistrum balloti]